MLLAGDIGGTKSRLAIFDRGADPRRPLAEETLPSGRYSGMEELIRAFFERTGLSAERACFAIAGPVIGGRSAVTNLPWIADAAAVRRTFGFASVRFLNDLAATARAVPLLTPAEIRTVSCGEPEAKGVIAVIAPGTGLGEAFLTSRGRRRQEHATEGGHADFAPRTPLQEELLKALRNEHGHVSYERVCSGPGIGRIYRFLKGRGMAEPASLAAKLSGMDDPVPAIVETALAQKSGICFETLNLFSAILGAEAGNLALKTLATGGVYIGGGIAPRILPFLTAGPFLSAFREKGRMADLLCRIPVHVIVEPRAALMGAAC
jgi:glucokinase